MEGKKIVIVLAFASNMSIRKKERKKSSNLSLRRKEINKKFMFLFFFLLIELCTTKMKLIKKLKESVVVLILAKALSDNIGKKSKVVYGFISLFVWVK